MPAGRLWQYLQWCHRQQPCQRRRLSVAVDTGGAPYTAPFVVSTRSRHQVSAALKNDHRDDDSLAFQVPLTVSDVHLRHEQLPFAYFFRETLDAQALQSSLGRVLVHFPVISGSIQTTTFQSIQCAPQTDTISLAFGQAVDTTLDQWLGTNDTNDNDKNNNSDSERGHSHVSGTGHPHLLPLFDALFDHGHDNNDDRESETYDSLVKIRVTYFECGGTAIGVNCLHALGDTASCVRFVQCWGREMQQLPYPRQISNRRATAACGGMMTEDLADLMGLHHPQQQTTAWWSDWWSPSSFVSTPNNNADKQNDNDRDQPPPCTNEGRHEYLALPFSPQVLSAMKEVGMEAIRNDKKRTDDSPCSYISTNDLVTAFGWLLKRALSGEHSWNISMVVNMRGRCGVDSFADMNDIMSTADDECNKNAPDQSSSRGGLFGNGITNVVAEHPSTQKSFGIGDVTGAARSIRVALTKGMLQLPERLFQSKMGKAAGSAHVSTAESFPTTSWSQFPLVDISFSSNQNIVAFHGHPSHPLPMGQSTYASVIMKSMAMQGDDTSSSMTTTTDYPETQQQYGVKYNLFLPSRKVEKAQRKHRELCKAFLEAQAQLIQQQQQLGVPPVHSSDTVGEDAYPEPQKRSALFPVA
ncbi:expressed unknown protein [Seminavis robusta]|uniref:Uncharacterized protein n=1 Tax=Seminavis robusta TaxID=568900 RepID=A0A9N8DZC2_9STRA|nr:expressed unknown protein [Seminavis robusta]|eukprot:Sro410_g137370.1 n/a (638) ;mRNA; r:24180-26093